MRGYALVLLLAVGVYFRFFAAGETETAINKERKQHLRECVKNMEAYNEIARHSDNASSTIKDLTEYLDDKRELKCPSLGEYTVLHSGVSELMCSIHGTVKTSHLETFEHGRDNSSYMLGQKCFAERRKLIPIAQKYIMENHRDLYEVHFTEIKEKLGADGQLMPLICPQSKEPFLLIYDSVHQNYHNVLIRCLTHFDATGDVKQWWEPEWIHKFKN
ncbi:MAG: hypothetical protein PHW04_01140 [Candidatus Wallbacteria bacterium]|nr:hypothetical protein [Candidatus Wallbacteria bacterium]